MAKVKVPAKVRAETEARLRRLARAGEVFVDGEAFKAVVPNSALNSGDEYCVDETRFIPVKQALMRLKRLEPGDCSAQAWRRFRYKDKAGAEHDGAAVVVPVDPHPKDVKTPHPVSPAMEEAFQGRVGVEELEFRGVPLLSVCAPIRDSFEDVVGVVEVFGSLAPDRLKVDTLNY